MSYNFPNITEQNLTIHYNSSSIFDPESNTFLTPAVAAKKKEDKTANELESQPTNRIDAIINAIFSNSKLPNNIADLVILYDDDPCEYIVRMMIKEKVIPKPLKLLAKQVTTLNLPDVIITENRTKLFKLFSSIDSLRASTSACGYNAVVILKKLQSLNLPQKLKSLDFSCNPSIEDDHLASITKLTKLQSLNLSNCIHLTGKSFASLGQLTTLQSLHLRKFNIADVGLTSLGQLQQLQDLDLQNCQEITDNDLTSIAQLTMLQHLNLAYCSQISDEGVASLIQLTDLRSLDLSGCEKITDKGLASLSQFKKLQYLKLNGCANITDQGLASLTALKKLQHLEMGNCIKITGDGLCDMILDELENLQILDLDGCTNVKTSEIAVLTRDTQDRHIPLKIIKSW